MITWLIRPPRPCCRCRARRAPLLRAEQTPLEPLPAHRGARPAQAKWEPHDQRGQPKWERRTRHL